MNNSVTIVPASETGALVQTYKSNPAYGYIMLASEEMSIDGGWVRTKKRSTLLRAETELLHKFVATVGKTGAIPGKIVVREFLESQVPENFKSRYNKNVSYEEQIAPYVKRAGKDGIELTLGGERILRFTDYDASGKEQDVQVSHDNVSAVQQSRASLEVSTSNTALGEDDSPF